MKSLLIFAVLINIMGCSEFCRMPVRNFKSGKEINSYQKIIKTGYKSQFFVNGIGVKRDAAEDTIDEINNIDEFKDIELFYNYTYGLHGDLAQASQQKMAEWARSVLKTSLNQPQIYSLEELVEIDRVIKKINQSKSSLILAHSQGNLFANLVCESVGAEVLGTYHLANPSHVLTDCSIDYITFTNDYVIKPILDSIKGNMKAGKCNKSLIESSMCHSFLFYFNNPMVRKKIIKDIFPASRSAYVYIWDGIESSQKTILNYETKDAVVVGNTIMDKFQVIINDGGKEKILYSGIKSIPGIAIEQQLIKGQNVLNIRQASENEIFWKMGPLKYADRQAAEYLRDYIPIPGKCKPARMKWPQMQEMRF